MTRHLDAELSSRDWDVLILHYLGLDHIGHLAGPYSPLVPGKLQEMDGVVEKIYNNVIKQVGLKHEIAFKAKSPEIYHSLSFG